MQHVRHQHHSERGSPGSHVTDRDCRLRPGNLRQRCRPHPQWRLLLSPWGVSTAREPPPPLHWRSSVPVGRCAAQATHSSEHCGGWPPPVLQRRSVARVATTSGAVAASVASRLLPRKVACLDSSMCSQRKKQRSQTCLSLVVVAVWGVEGGVCVWVVCVCACVRAWWWWCGRDIEKMSLSISTQESQPQQAGTRRPSGRSAKKARENGRKKPFSTATAIK